MSDPHPLWTPAGTGQSGAALAVAACAFAAPLQGDGAGRWLLQVLPAQDFAPVDGRAMDVPAWRINAAIAAKLVAALSSAQPPVIDYEHQTLHKEANGAPAPAAGWMHGLRWVEGRGLFAVAELTERARALIEAGEYRYFSPVFEYDRGSGDITRVLMGALTNHPAIAGMQALDTAQAAAAARFFTPPVSTNKESAVTLLEQLIAALGLSADTSEDQAIIALSERLDGAPGNPRDSAQGADKRPEVGQAAASAASPVPDPARYVPTAVVQELQTSVAALTAAAREREVDDLVRPALADGRLLPAMQAWARDLGQSNLAALSQYLASAQPLAALTHTQTGGCAPAASAPQELSAQERAVASACGLTPEAFAKARSA